MNEENKYYDRVYLCVRRNDTSTWDVRIFDTFHNADMYHTDEYKIRTMQSTMIPMCKYVPKFMDKWFIKWKINNMFKPCNNIYTSTK